MEIEELVSKEKHQELCNFLKLTKVSDHPDYANWDIYKVNEFITLNLTKNREEWDALLRSSNI